MSDRTVYAIASGKGGVGKTTTAINLGAMLADRGHEVVVVDTDLGMANLADFLDFEIESPTLHEVLAGDADAMAAVHRAPADIDVLPSAPDIEAFVRSDPANLGEVVADLRAEYDYVLLDTGAGVSYDVLVPLALADGVLLVATPDVASVRDTAKTGDLASRVESEVVGAVLAQRSSDILTAGDVEETLGTDVLAVVPQDEAVPMGIDAGRPLAAFAPNAPAGQAYRDLAAVLTGETDPDPELDLGGSADVDAAFDAPSRQSGESDSAADRATGESLPGGDRDLGGHDREPFDEGESEGLLGGELARAAEEIREEAQRAADGSAASAASREDRTGGVDSAESTPSAPGEGEIDPTEQAGIAPGEGAEADPTEESGIGPTDGGSDSAEETGTGPAESGAVDADATDGSEARSVDDLIDEHLSDDHRQGDDRLQGDDQSGDRAGDDRREDDDRSGHSHSGGKADPLAGDDPLTGMDSDASDADARGEGTSEEERPADVDESAVRRDAVGTERASDGQSDPDAVPFEEGVGTGGGKAARSDEEDDDNSGVLGRLGSLFK